MTSFTLGISMLFVGLVVYSRLLFELIRFNMNKKQYKNKCSHKHIDYIVK